MKILFWADGFWPRIGGAETYGLQFVEGMQKRGHQCLVLAQKDHPDWKDNEAYKDILIKRFDFDALIEKRDLKNIRSIKESLEGISKEFQPDLVYLNTLGRGSTLVFLLFRNMFPVRTLVRVHSPYWNEIPPLVKEVSALADQICCVSTWVLTVMEKFLPSLKNKLRLVYNGLPTPKLAPDPLPFSPPTILILGRLSLEKGFDTAVEAFSLLKKNGSNAELLIAGEGANRLLLEQLVNNLELKDSVQFIGEIAAINTPSIINRATLVVIPSLFEAFGFVALEAMQMQRPVIASNVGGLQEIISDHETGLLVPPQDPLAFYKAMKDLLSHPEKTIEMGLQGRKRALEKFTLDRNLDQYEDLFQECCFSRSSL